MGRIRIRAYEVFLQIVHHKSAVNQIKAILQKVGRHAVRKAAFLASEMD